ncbi:putative amino acid permease [Hortaea werneckii]|nr:putative amino acid permease [Hortaea werneckii]KAI7301020.1 putative amino acid permease [Hortaea werneckii]
MAFTSKKAAEASIEDNCAAQGHPPQVSTKNGLHRSLSNRQVQLICIGGAIGTSLFIRIGNGLAFGGPASLLIAYIMYSSVLALISNCLAEMTVAYPVSGGFIRQAGHWVDDALGFMAGWNYLLLNTVGVKVFGEAEFWLSSGKVILILSLLMFTFITMVGGNPNGDAYGFRYWNEPGAFAAYLSTGSIGRFEGFLACLWNASFAVVGPEYISIVAAEVYRPRRSLRSAFKTVYARFGLFFIGTALSVGIVIPYNNSTLQAIAAGELSSSSAAATPWVIAMENLGIRIFPHIVNLLLFTCLFSAGNTYTFCAIRNLYALALEGRAHRIFAKTTSNGTPIFACMVVTIFPLLSLMQVGSTSAEVLNWLVSLITAGGVVNYIVITITYICFYRACLVQGVKRSELPYFAWYQPWCAYIGLAWMLMIILFYGYSSFRPWDVGIFFQHYTMVILDPILFIVWKLLKRTKWLKPYEVDLVWEKPEIDEYEAELPPYTGGTWNSILRFCRLRK